MMDLTPAAGRTTAFPWPLKDLSLPSIDTLAGSPRGAAIYIGNPQRDGWKNCRSVIACQTYARRHGSIAGAFVEGWSTPPAGAHRALDAMIAAAVEGQLTMAIIPSASTTCPRVSEFLLILAECHAVGLPVHCARYGEIHPFGGRLATDPPALRLWERRAAWARAAIYVMDEPPFPTAGLQVDAAFARADMLGVRVIGSYFDRASSAGLSRPGLSGLLKGAEAGDFGTVIVADLDRLAVSSCDMDLIWARLQKYRIELRCLGWQSGNAYARLRADARVRRGDANASLCLPAVGGRR